MIPSDYLFGSFEFDTTVKKDEEGYYVASACGRSAKAVSQDQAINDLNAKLNQAIERGELVPQNGN